MDVILDIISRELKTDRGALTDDTALADIASWDSLKHMDLIAALEGDLGIEFTGDEIADMLSVGKIVETTTAHIRQKV